MKPVARIVHSRLAPLVTVLMAAALFVGCSQTADNSITSHSTDAIIGGVILKPNHPIATMTALLYNTDFKKNVCTVTLLSEQYAITAAHCIEIAREKSFELVFGVTNDPKNQRRPVLAARTLRERVGREAEVANAFDVALIKFSGGLPPGYKPATLLPEKYEKLLKAGSYAAVAGYGVEDANNGKIDTLRLADLTIFRTNLSLTEIMLDQTHGHAACQGDSGGPAFLYINGKFYFWGVASRDVDTAGTLSEGCSQYAVYTNGLLFLPGLKEQIER